MCWKMFNLGQCCGPEPFLVDWVNMDADEPSYARRAFGGAPDPVYTGAEFAGGAVDIAGGAYAPSFDGRGVGLGAGSSPTRGLYEFDIETGVDNGLLAAVGAFTASQGRVFQECAGYVCFLAPNLQTVNTAGTVAAAAGGPYSNTRTALRRSGGDIWRTITTGGLLIKGNDSTTRSDLSSVAIEADNIVAVVSNDGEDIYALGYKSDWTKVEVFHVVGSTGTATRLNGHDAAGSGDGGSGFTLIGGFIFWKVPGDGRIWRYNIAANEIEDIISGVADTSFLGWGQGFFAENDD